MEAINFEELVRSYIENKTELDRYKKLVEKDGAVIKSLIKDYDNVFEVDGYTIKLTTQNRETIDEDGLLMYLKDNVENPTFIRTKEYIDDDALESAIYKEKISKDIIAGMSKFSTVKEIETLRVSKSKGNKS